MPEVALRVPPRRARRVTGWDHLVKDFHGSVDLKGTAGEPTGPRVIPFTITTEDVDRDRDLVLASGIDTDEYLRNPVFLWGHKFDQPPVGKCIGLRYSAGRWRAFIEFAEDETADRIFRLYKGGFLNAVSIGFKVVKAGPPDYSVYQERPHLAPGSINRVIYACRLLEISAVPIPSNPNALQEASRKGIISPQFAEGLAMPETIPASGLVDWLSKSLPNWSRDRIEALTVKEMADLVALTPDDPAEITKEMPTQTAEGDQVCPKCGKSGVECKCDGGDKAVAVMPPKKGEEGDESGADDESDGEDEDARKGLCPKCGKAQAECSCGDTAQQGAADTCPTCGKNKSECTCGTNPVAGQPPATATKGYSLDGLTSGDLERIADRTFKHMTSPEVVSLLAKQVGQAMEQQVRRLQGKV